MKQRIFCQPTDLVYSSVFHPEPKTHLLLSLSLTHLPKVDTLTPSAGAVHIPQGAITPRTPTASISWSHVPLCGPLQMPWAVPWTIPSQGVINACLLQKGQTISPDGRWGL